MTIQHVTDEHYYQVYDVINDWWGGRAMQHLVQPLFFHHFQQTSFIIEHEQEMRAFLIGFLSQTNPAIAYIHLVGVHPDDRAKGLARQLYTHFFNVVQQVGCETVQCITSPTNEASIRFHEALGFTSQKVEHYTGDGQARIVFQKALL